MKREAQEAEFSEEMIIEAYQTSCIFMKSNVFRGSQKYKRLNHIPGCNTCWYILLVCFIKLWNLMS